MVCDNWLLRNSESVETSALPIITLTHKPVSTILKSREGQLLISRPTCLFWIRYQPFLLDDNGDILTPEKYDAYCDDIEKTAKWGGQCELLALSTALQRPIKVFQAGTPPQDIGAGGDPILLSFHQHEWSLGAHYNAVIQKS